jgi:hypothetical protein
MPHKIEISDKTYNELKEYCTLNHIKMGQYADKLLYESLMIEKYGDTPFTNYHIKLPQEIKVIEVKGTLNKDGTFEQEGVKPIDEETKAQMIEVMEKVETEHPQTYITNQEGEKEIQKEMLKQLGVPDKAVNKIIRRRLK